MIQNHIIFSEDLTIGDGNYLIIDTNGILCGHYILYMYSGGKLLNEGILFFYQGQFYGGDIVQKGKIYSDSEVRFGKEATFHQFYGGKMFLGPEFDCDNFTIIPKDTTSYYTKTAKPKLSMNTVINPVVSHLAIDYFIPDDLQVEIKLFGIRGEMDLVLRDEYQSKGNHHVLFDVNSLSLSSGIYVIRIKAGSEIVTRKIMVIKN